jgi:hypothetical protein
VRRSARLLSELPERLVATLLPDGVHDDVALLVARVRGNRSA